MEVAVQQGKILYAGSSNLAGWHLAKAQAAAEKRNYTGWFPSSRSTHLLKSARSNSR